MTIALSDNTPRVSYTVSQGATQTAFTVNFEFFDDADLNFYVDGTLKTLTTHYTVSGGDGSTGTINTTAGNTVTGISGGSTVVITRDIDLARTTDFPSSGAFEVATLNTELDRFIAIAADLKDSSTRSLRLADDDSAATMTLPTKASRLGKILGFHSSTGIAEVVNHITTAAVNVSTVSVGGSATASVSISGNTATFALGIPTGATGATGATGDVSLAGTQTLTNKTLTAPKINEDVALTSTATELNLLDGVSGLVQADFTKLAAIDASATELNQLDGKVAKTAGKESIWVPAGAMYPSTTNGCAGIAQVETTALRPDLNVLDFATGADEFAQFSVAFPKSWNEGQISFQPFWTVSGTDTGTVAWQLGAVAVSNDDTIDVAFPVSGGDPDLTPTTALAHSGTSNDLMVSAESAAFTILGSPAAGDCCFFQINRDADAGDQSGDARLIGIKLFFTTDAANDA
jgi:hypothetical protein